MVSHPMFVDSSSLCEAIFRGTTFALIGLGNSDESLYVRTYFRIVSHRTAIPGLGHQGVQAGHGQFGFLPCTVGHGLSLVMLFEGHKITCDCAGYQI